MDFIFSIYCFSFPVGGKTFSRAVAYPSSLLPQRLPLRYTVTLLTPEEKFSEEVSSSGYFSFQ